ncbi:MAG: methionine gamma-lyase family protein [Clostridia bacterium]|nr:methionine gamma-lyase family protein [Clostridia bacterium]
MSISSLFNVSEKIVSVADVAENKVKDVFKNIDSIAYENQAKVLEAFKHYKVSNMHFGYTTGYGYSDAGREVIENIYARIFKAEDSLVRVQFVNATHAIATTLFACLNRGDELVYVTGKPYDSILQTIGIEENDMSLISKGVKYSEIELINNEEFDTESIVRYLKENKVKMIGIQRSKGYADRKSIEISQIEKVIKEIRKINKDVIIFVDNCYGEFVEQREPIEVGANLCVGSLIKNMGGSLCETGAYVVGDKKLVERVAMQLTCPGIGKECGATMNQNRNMLQGLFISPCIVANALKSMVFASAFLEELGFNTKPRYDEKRTDIVQTVKFEKEEELIKFIQGLQIGSPVDSHVIPYPWDMPGYTDKVIMAAGTFIEGASIELSADSPIRKPYIAYMQGGITYESAKLALIIATDNMLKGE